MVNIRWTQGAAADLENIFEYIAKDSLQYARLQVENLTEAVEKLKNYPRIGRRLPEFHRLPHREIIVGNYRVIYRYDIGRKAVYVATIAHGRRQLKNLMDQ
jgi:toxin ParE1/3/4